MSFEKDTTFCVPLWINGAVCCPEGSPKYDITTPPSQYLTWTACAATPSTIKQAISSASQAFPSWSKTAPSARISIFAKAADILESKTDEVLYYFQKEIGAGEAWSSFNQKFCVKALRSIGDVLEDALRTEVVDGMDGMQGIVSKVPYGVVAAIAPWNAPLILGLRAILAPIAAGNTVVMLAAPLSPLTHHFIALLLDSAGLPPGVLNVLPAPPSPENAAEVVETLLEHPSVRYLNFTGSTAVGRKINEVAGRYGKPVTMELGGKCVALVLKDADLDKLAHELVIGAYLNAGQICMSTEHAIIPSVIAPALIEKLITTVPKIFPQPFPLITTGSKNKVLNLIADAKEKGAAVYTSRGEETEHNFLEEITSDTSSSLPPFFIKYDGDIEEGINLTNELEFGLSVSIFSADENEAIKVAGEIDSGAVHINHMTVYDNPSFPHGGVKASGYGRFGGKWGIEEFTYVKTVTRII
ncbi:Omega-crystallin [Dactylellina cionopaga]|nr:Omega-crystallin [Dactylellina cionopaga]